ncbi:MAG TPA: choice-of-anchor X domain-containing protein [Pyrinomonadaceae bacterium]|nr:choice-of-anchor X domain-containing protein [Pyrinomonadaceae bacterium]
MRYPLHSRFFVTIMVGLLLLLAAGNCSAQTFTLNLPNRASPKLPVARIKVTLELTGAPTAGVDQLSIFGGTKLLTNSPSPSFIPSVPNVVLFYRSGNSVVIDAQLRPLLNPATLCEPVTASTFPTTLSFTVTLGGGNTITGHRLNSYSALSANQCTCLRRRLDDPGATWTVAPPGTTKRHPLDVVLVLDRSGSMGDSVAGTTKMGLLKTAVKQFISEWRLESGGPPGDDRISLVWFDSLITFNPSPRGFIRRDALAPNNWESLNAAIDGQAPGSSTAMGDGLSQGVDVYEDLILNEDATIVLMTDGIQNDGNLITPSNCNVAPPCEFNHLNLPGYEPIKNVCIPVITIGLGLPGDLSTDVLNGIAQQTASLNFQAIDTVGLANAFGGSLVETLKGNTMSVLTQTTGSMNSGSSSVTPAATFKLDSSVSRALVVLGWSGSGNANALRLELTKPPSGPPITVTGQVNDPFYMIQAVDIPASGNAGDWKANVIRNAGSATVPFYITVYTFEGKFGSRFEFKSSQFGTGDDIVLTAALQFGNQPLLGQGNKIQVRVERPESALNTVLHKLNVSAAQLSTQPPGLNPENNTPYDRKLFLLLQSTSLAQDIEPKPDPTIFQMVDDGSAASGDAVAGDGIYSMRYSNTRLPGRYRFKVSMQGLTTPGGVVDRFEQRDAEVNVLQIDSKESTVDTTRVTSGNYRVDIVPADRFGNFLGPGYARQIKVTLTGTGTVLPAVIDERENGTYTVKLTGVADPENTRIKVSYVNQPFSDITVEDAGKPKKRFAVFGGIGGNFPHGDFNTFFDSGISTQAGFEFMFTNRLSAETTFGFDRFGFSSVFPGDLKVYRGSANVKFYPVIGTFQFGVFGGGGAYHFTFGGAGSTRGGINFGTVAEYRINTHWSVEGTYNFHNVFTSGSSTRFSTAQAGVRFRF